MIDSAITILAARLNQFLKRTFDLPEDIVVLSNILEQNGSVAPHVNNKLVMFLVNIEKDTTPARRDSGHRSVDRHGLTHPPVHLNLYVMLAGHFTGSTYPEALKFISHAISFFQRQPVFDHQSSPDLDPRIDRLVLEIENLDLKDLSSLWSILSSKYLPSVLYKVRMVTFDAGDVVRHVPAVKEPQSVIAIP